MSTTNLIDAELERQYNNRAAVPEHVDIMANWERRSESFRAGAACRLDCAYGPGERDKADVFLGGHPGGPLLVYIHGGYWARGDKRLYSFLAESFTRNGINVALINYDLCPAVRIGDIAPQIRRALVWLWRSADEFGYKRDRIQVCGHSAGGHLSTMTLVTDWHGMDADLPANLVHSAIAISGVYELQPLLRTSVNDAVRMDTAEARDNSPVLMTPAAQAPLVVAVGANESAEFIRQSATLVDTWKIHNANTRYLEVPDTNHFTIVNELAGQQGELFAHAMELLNS